MHPGFLNFTSHFLQAAYQMMMYPYETVNFQETEYIQQQ